MASAFERLVKILELERKNGYRNRAVIGGLEKFLPGWASVAVSEPGGAALVERVNAALNQYAAKSPDDRAAAIKTLLGSEGQVTALRRRGDPEGPSGERGNARPAESDRRERGEATTPRPNQTTRGPRVQVDETPPARSSRGMNRPGPRPTTETPPPARGVDPVEQENRSASSKPLPNPGQREDPVPSRPASGRPASGETRPERPNLPRPAHQMPPKAKNTADNEASSPPAPPAKATKPAPQTPPKPPAPKRPPTPPAPTDGETPEGGLSFSAGPVAVADPPAMPRPTVARRGPSPTIPATGSLDGPVTQIPGISSVYAKHLARLGVNTIRDMLFLVPRRYDDFSKLKTIHELVYGEEATIVGTVQNTVNRRSNKGMTVTTTVLSDATGYIQATFFNQPYLLQQLRPGRQIVMSGRVDAYLGKLVYQAPEWEPLDQELVHTARLVPVYPLTQGIGARWMRNTVKRVVDAYAAKLNDPLPDAVRQANDLMPMIEAVRQAHFPDDNEKLAAARQRLAFDEFFVIQLGVLRQRRLWQSNEGRALPVSEANLNRFLAALPFSLTGAQQRVLTEILTDMNTDRPMSRLLQGDVGSGKTVVAAAAMVAAVENGCQAALMVPTEILAEQHTKSLRRIFGRWAEATGEPAKEVALLTGSLTKSERETTYAAIATGQTSFIVGTHAVIQSGVEFANLGLAVVDEQHRFGVGQRAALRQKGSQAVPHLLVMTATPIPRTLALTVYGDLDLSIINELPPGRTPIKTKWVLPRERERAYSFVESQVRQGRQAFVICPLIEESETLEAKAAVQEYERLQRDVFPQFRLGLLHGKMKPADKDAVMAEFYRGDTHILVSTSVVEVGIDVPNATVMLIEGANRFGLAQLHQFRGRVGRGEHQSFCLLVADENISDEGKVRLEAMERTQDGFELAEEDLKLRGPGEFFGTRQSGLPDLSVAKLSDVKTLEMARRSAEELFQQDPDFTAPEHRPLRAAVDKFWAGEGDLS